jgi:putative transposase
MAKLLEEIKKPSSIWMKQQERGIAHFARQAGYGIFSVGQSQLPGLLQYIDNQEEHHRTRTFKEELLELLEKCGVEYDEKYLWD